MIRITVVLVLLSACFNVGANAETYFRKAQTLAERNVAIVLGIRQYMEKENPGLTKIQEARMLYIMSVAETAGMCALLGGNIIGGAGEMSASKRKEYETIVTYSVDACRQFIEFRRMDLVILINEHKGTVLSDFAEDMVFQLNSLESELEFKV